MHNKTSGLKENDSGQLILETTTNNFFFESFLMGFLVSTGPCSIHLTNKKFCVKTETIFLLQMLIFLAKRFSLGLYFWESVCFTNPVTMNNGFGLIRTTECKDLRSVWIQMPSRASLRGLFTIGWCSSSDPNWGKSNGQRCRSFFGTWINLIY